MPLAVLSAMALPDGVVMNVFGYKTVDTAAWIGVLPRESEELGNAHRCRFLGAAPRREMISAARRAHIGRALVHPFAGGCGADPNLVNITGASVTVFDYVSLGIPVLVSDDSQWSAFVHEGLAFACDLHDPKAIAVTLTAAQCSYLVTIGQVARERIMNEWCYEIHYAAVTDAIIAEGTHRRSSNQHHESGRRSVINAGSELENDLDSYDGVRPLPRRSTSVIAAVGRVWDVGEMTKSASIRISPIHHERSSLGR